MGFFKDLKSRVRGMQNQMQGPMSPQMPPPFMRRRQAPGTVLDLETGLPPVRPPLSNLENIGLGAMAPDKFMPGGGFGPLPRRLPQIMPERRMPQQRPSNRFFGGGLGSIFSRLPNQRGRERMSPPLPRAPLPMPQDMPRERFPMMRPGFAAGEEVNSNMLIAEQGAREGMSPPEMAAQRMKEFLGETGRTVSDRDIELFSVGMLTLEDIIDRAEPVTNRNLEQQEQMFFPKEEKSFRDFQQAFKGTGLGDFLSFIPDVTQVGNYMNYKRGLGSLDDILEDLEKKN
mgnify:FL=1